MPTSFTQFLQTEDKSLLELLPEISTFHVIQVLYMCSLLGCVHWKLTSERRLTSCFRQDCPNSQYPFDPHLWHKYRLCAGGSETSIFYSQQPLVVLPWQDREAHQFSIQELLHLSCLEPHSGKDFRQGRLEVMSGLFQLVDQDPGPTLETKRRKVAYSTSSKPKATVASVAESIGLSPDQLSLKTQTGQYTENFPKI